MNLREMSRKEKFRYLKAKGFKCKATMKTEDLDRLLSLDQPPAEQESIRGSRAEQDRRRVPLGKYRSKMDASHLENPHGRVRRWINDRGGRLNDALEGGYQFVQDPNREGVGEDPLQPQGAGSAVSIKAGTNEDGSPLRAYLMEIDRDLYEEDQAYKAKELDKMEDAIKGGQLERQAGDGRYIPKDGISYNPKG